MYTRSLVCMLYTTGIYMYTIHNFTTKTYLYGEHRYDNVSKQNVFQDISNTNCWVVTRTTCAIGISIAISDSIKKTKMDKQYNWCGLYICMKEITHYPPVPSHFHLL